ncbi:uncharacterized protein LOC132732039 [Ruditapes philippinarum]|uniref:uncharacterized protein LOC132732039 n=1 Tax=Ruditapes philippinarum TaxID=129788 RepID=UPI00295BAC27|nr:uncharacterized protein LOC132732039 [Ruditapes philippinarum]
MKRGRCVLSILLILGLLIKHARGQATPDSVQTAVLANAAALNTILFTTFPTLIGNTASVIPILNSAQAAAINNAFLLAQLNGQANQLAAELVVLTDDLNTLGPAVTALGAGVTNVGVTIDAIQVLQTMITNSLATTSTNVGNLENAVAANSLLINGIESKACALDKTFDEVNENVNRLEITITDTNMRIQGVENTIHGINGFINAIELLLTSNVAKIDWLKKSAEKIKTTAHTLIDLCQSITNKIDMVKNQIDAKKPALKPLLNDIESSVEIIHESRNLLGFFDEKVNFLTARVDVLFLSKEITHISHTTNAQLAIQKVA